MLCRMSSCIHPTRLHILVSYDIAMNKETLALVKKLLWYSWKETKGDYNNLTEKEKAIITKSDYERLYFWCKNCI